MKKRVEPPGGWAPPQIARYGARPVDLGPLAEAVADRHLAEHPDDVETYGEDMARRWCVHDVRHLLNWALDDLVDLGRQVDWLAGVLEARGYPLESLADCLRITADVAAERVGPEPAERLRAAAERVSSR